jgi:hypothetical protein
LVARALELEVSLLAVTAVLAAATSVHPGDASGYALIVLMSFAIGVRTRLAAHRRTGPDDNGAHDDTGGPGVRVKDNGRFPQRLDPEARCSSGNARRRVEWRAPVALKAISTSR